MTSNYILNYLQIWIWTRRLDNQSLFKSAKIRKAMNKEFKVMGAVCLKLADS